MRDMMLGQVVEEEQPRATSDEALIESSDPDHRTTLSLVPQR